MAWEKANKNIFLAQKSSSMMIIDIKLFLSKKRHSNPCQVERKAEFPGDQGDWTGQPLHDNMGCLRVTVEVELCCRGNVTST